MKARLDFVEIYESYAADVYRFAYWLAGEAAEAEDITSDTFIRAWARRDASRTETLKAYLFVIARNIYLERLRKERRSVPLEDVHRDPAPGPDRHTEARQELENVLRLLLDLPEIDRAAFLLRVQHGLPYEETARVLGISVVAAKVKVHRVRRMLLRDRMKREVP
jgi:RNA polymerase sigma-70 factor, ECF subfamily